MFEKIILEEDFFSHIPNVHAFCDKLQSVLKRGYTPMLILRPGGQDKLFNLDQELFEDTFNTLVRLFSLLNDLHRYPSVAIIENFCSDYFLDLALNCRTRLFYWQ
jgi:hypothetical protein